MQVENFDKGMFFSQIYLDKPYYKINHKKEKVYVVMVYDRRTKIYSISIQ